MIGYLYYIRNTDTNSVYVGSTFNPVKRKKLHFKQLNNGTHHSIILQRAYLKYGMHKFVFENLTTVVVESDKELKQHRTMSIQDKLNHPQFKPIMIDNHIYYSCSDAAKALSCTSGNITYKLKSEKHSNYRYLNKSELKFLKMEVSV